MPRSRRSEERVSAALPVSLEGSLRGRTRDISASGLYFEVDSDAVPDGPLQFSITFSSPSGPMRLEGVAEVVRREPREGRVGIAARIVESRLGRDLEAPAIRTMTTPQGAHA